MHATKNYLVVVVLVRYDTPSKANRLGLHLYFLGVASRISSKLVPPNPCLKASNAEDHSIHMPKSCPRFLL